MPDTDLPLPDFQSFFHKLLWVLVVCVSSLVFAWASHVESKLSTAEQTRSDISVRLAIIDSKLDLLLKSHSLVLK